MRGSDEQPIFVIGSPRSGTSLLRLMLASHPLVVIPPEAGFAMWLYPRYESWSAGDGYEGFIADLLETRKFEFWSLDRADVLAGLDADPPEDYGGLIAGVYRCYARRVKPGATRWGDKNNTYVTEVRRINRLFPQARFVHIVRDGRNVAVSYRRLLGRDIRSEYAPRLSSDIAEIAHEWSHNVSEADDAMAAIAGAMTIRLEDLTLQPRDVLEEVCRSVGLRFEESMLRYHELTAAEGGEPAEFLQWKEKNLLPLQSDGAEEYQKELTADEIKGFHAVAGPALARFGYPT